MADAGRAPRQNSKAAESRGRAQSPPADLGPAGRRVWELAWALSRIEAEDAPSIQRLALLEDEACELRQVLAAEGRTLKRPVQNSRGEKLGEETYAHPCVNELRKLDRAIGALQDALGLSPAGRRKMGIEPTPEPAERDWLDELRAQPAVAAHRGRQRPVHRTASMKDREPSTNGHGKAEHVELPVEPEGKRNSQRW